jgi:tetratricopeptide (TPR) repeat protein
MAEARRKITKKELKQDKLVTFYYNARNFLSKNGKKVAIAVGSVLGLAIIIGLIINSKFQANKTAGYELYQAQISYDNADFQDTADKLKKITETYPGTKNAAEALVQLARAYYQSANYDSAIYYADKFLRKRNEPLLTCNAYNLKAASWEQKGEFVSAGKVYEEAGHKYSELYIAPIFLTDAARCFNLAGDDKKALELYNEVVEKYPGSEITPRAGELISRAGGKAIEQPPKFPIGLF